MRQLLFASRYTGFPELLREIRDHVKVDLMVRPIEAQNPESIAGVVANAMEELRETMERTQMSLDTTAMTATVVWDYVHTRVPRRGRDRR